MKIQFKHKESYLLIFVLLIGSILRLYNAFEIPFTHDEFSALFRTHFDNFSSLIDQGVKIDAHPAGVQVFLYYWTALFGTKEIIVKLPFILMGIGAIYLLYLIACNWYNSTVAIIAALFLATLEFPIMHSQIARPYISGLFLVLWMVYHWSLYLFSTKKAFNKHLLLYVIASALCAYNHHFSLLFAGIVGFSGLIFIGRDRLLAYVLAGLSIFLLYLPHLPIFFYQLNVGGIGGEDGWLGAPADDFLWQFIRYIFSFSKLLWLLVIAIIILGLRYRNKEFNAKRKFFYLSFAWFLIPFLIGYFYSISINPVLQYSVLLFSFPFLFFILFGHIGEWDLKAKWMLLIIASTVLLYTLIIDRQYYRLFYHSAYMEMIEESLHFEEENQAALSLLDTEEKIIDFYLKRDSIDLPYLSIRDFPDRYSIISFLKSVDAKEISFGANATSDAMLPAILYDHFPSLQQKTDLNQATYFEFSKDKKREEELYRNKVFVNTFEELSQYWNWNLESVVIADSVQNNHAYAFKSDQEWGLSIKIPLNELELQQNDIIDIRLDCKSWGPEDELLIVSEISSEGMVYDWRATSNREFIPRSDSSSYRMYHAIKLSDIDFPRNGAHLKVFCWNKGKTPIIVDDFSIKVRKGNPILYGLYQKIEHN